MAIDPDRLIALRLPEVRQHYGWRDSILYALGTGYGMDPTDTAQLRFLDETRLLAVPTMANVLGYPGFWMRDLDTGIDWAKVVHGEQAMRLHRPLASEGDVIGRSRIVDIVDKGAGKGALVYVERRIRDASDGAPIATLLQTVFCRGDGGFGGKSTASRPVRALPERAPDLTLALPTQPQTALIYRLSGDLNPLHADPAVARAAGFDRPILHGLASFGVAGHALLARLCGYDPARFLAIEGRFSAPVYPGETISVDIWQNDIGQNGIGQAAFRAHVEARGVTAITGGWFEYAV